MLKQVKALTRTRFKKTNFNAFLFFLFFAVVIWIFVQFSREYNEVIEIPVEYVNVPSDKLITVDNQKSIKLRMIDNGFRLAYYYWLPPTLTVDVSETTETGDQLFYVIDEHRADIQEQLNIDFENSRFVNDFIAIDFQQKQEKKVPLLSRIEIQFEAGYAASSPLQIEPDSIQVSGPDKIMDTLTRLYTVPLQLKNLKRDISGDVAIDTSGMRNLSLSPTRATYSLDVEKFTEGSVEVPVELINVPEGLNVVIFPKEILVFYQVNLRDFNQVTTSDFRVVADFSEMEEDQDFMIPEVRQQPEFVTNLRMNEKKIQFIIKK